MSSTNTPAKNADPDSGPSPTDGVQQEPLTTLPENLTDTQLEHLQFFVSLCTHLQNPVTVIHMTNMARHRSWGNTQTTTTPRHRLFRSTTRDEHVTQSWTISYEQAHAEVQGLLSGIKQIRTTQDFRQIVAAYPALVALNSLARESTGMPVHPDVREERVSGLLWSRTRIVYVPGGPRAFAWLSQQYQNFLRPTGDAS